MEAKELRLNNYVFGIYIEETENADIEEKCICSVDVIDGVGCTEYNIWASSIEDKGKLIEEWERFEPIPLTEKWLLDFGFIKTNGRHGDYFYHKEKELFRVWMGLESLWGVGRKDPNSINQMYNTHWIVLDLKFVHQLQNLFYSLCGEELTINTPTMEGFNESTPKD